jgi:hypothetical protein
MALTGSLMKVLDRWSIKKFKLLKQHNPNKCVHKKEKGNKSGLLVTIKCLKFIHMWDRMILNAGNGKFIGGLLFMASYQMIYIEV